MLLIKTKKKVVMLIFGMLIVVGISIFVGVYKVTAPTALITHNLLKESQWRDVILKNGPTKAYSIFSASLSGKNINRQHTAAHAFGGALYTTTGVPGFSTCDNRFSYGCFHEFIGRAISDHGISIVSRLNEQCINTYGDTPGFCQHGIGHGLIAYFGYSESSLEKALSVCNTLRDNDPIGGCNGGIFMEYNIRSILVDTLKPRPSKGNFLYPCNKIQIYAQPACAYWAPQWWYFTDFHNYRIRPVFSSIGKRCELFEKQELRRRCFSGIGVIVDPSFSLTTKKEAIVLCKNAAHENTTYADLCIATIIRK